MKNKLLFILLLLGQNLFSESNYTRENNLVYDQELKLYWQDDTEASHTKLSLNDSIIYCNNLSLNNHNNWRLPTYEELLSIGDYEVYKPTLNNIFQNSASGHFWSLIYKRVAYGKEWTPKNEFYVQRIYFSDGYSYDNDRTGKAYVRCVRDNNDFIS